MARPGIIAQRQQHVRELCGRHRIDPVYQRPGDSHGRASPAARRVLIPRTTGVRSYYVALHEIAHCVLGFDRTQLLAPQEAAAWRWAFEEAIEPPSQGVKRMVFKVLWHYVLDDLGKQPADDLSNAQLFPGPDDKVWPFLADLDEAARLLYEAAKVTARAGPGADIRRQVRAAIKTEREASRDAVARARREEQLRAYGPPRLAHAGELTLLGAGDKAHIWAEDGRFGTVTRAVLCGATGVAHPPASPKTTPCKHCQALALATETPGPSTS
jgi:hypothetical protein